MRKEIEAEMKARIDTVVNNAENDNTRNAEFAKAEVERIKADAQRESNRLDTEDSANMTWDMFQSYIKAGFSEEQAWTLTQIVIGNATRPRLF